MFFWYKKLDKPLVFTQRVRRFFIFLFVLIIFQDTLCITIFNCLILGIIFPIVFALVLSFVYEKILFENYKKEALNKLSEFHDLKIVAVTASYGKTSIKNFLYHILSSKFSCYKTPRSVNTLHGLVQDINNSLPKDTKIYIAEAGAREIGDIKDIADFLKPHIGIVGQIGPAHLEYFKTLENIRNTKMELITSVNIEKMFVHKSTNAVGNDKVTIFGDEVISVEANLDGTTFVMKIENEEVAFFTKLLGDFNAQNLAVCVLLATYLGISIKDIKDKIASIKSVPHRLERIDSGGKIILDDSFNGNFEGISSSYELVRQYNGRKVLITPGIIESSNEDNIKLAKIADNIFDLIIITGVTNLNIFDCNIKKADKIVLKDKKLLIQTLEKFTFKGDLILFSNDTPTYI